MICSAREGSSELQRLPLGVHHPPFRPRAGSGRGRVVCAEVAAANGALAVGSPAVSGPVNRLGGRAHPDGLDLRRFCSQHRILGRAPTAAGRCGARLEWFVLRGHDRPLRDPDGATTRSAMVRRHDSDHLSLLRRGISVDVRDLSRNVDVMRSAASLASRLMLNSPPRMS